MEKPYLNPVLTQSSQGAKNKGMGQWIDKVWLQLASVKLTLFLLVALLLLSIPGTVILQLNISNVDPGSQYSYDFWTLGQKLQLFTAYHSFWYVGLMVLLSMNLIACSVERWPQMWRLANAKPVAWAQATFDQVDSNFKKTWSTNLSKDQALQIFKSRINENKATPVVVQESEDSFQIFFQKGRWSRVANYLVHTSLLVIFAGAIITALYGFEGAASIPEGSAVDTFLLFTEGKASGLKKPDPKNYPVGQVPLVNEKLLGFRLHVEDFDVEFYEQYPSRPRDFVTQLNVIRGKQTLKSGEIRVNSPMSFENFTFYQASYGRMGQFTVSMRVMPVENGRVGAPLFSTANIGEPQTFEKLGIELVVLQAHENLQNIGQGILVGEIKNGQLKGEPFWVIKKAPEFDLKRGAPYMVVLDNAEEQLFTGLQIGYDPGAPLYWLGCLGMLIGTFYALLVTHRKFQLRYQKGEVVFAGTIHRLPSGFENQVQRWAQMLEDSSKSINKGR